jgi:hypothetical protein
MGGKRRVGPEEGARIVGSNESKSKSRIKIKKRIKRKIRSKIKTAERWYRRS